MPARSGRRLVVSVAAKLDLDDALLYTRRRWDAEQRRRYRNLLNQAMHSLLDFPERGRPRDELYPGCRSPLAEEGIIFYSLDERQIVMDRVPHGSQNAPGIIH